MHVRVNYDLNLEPQKFGNHIPILSSSHIPHLTIQKSLPYKLATIELKTTQEKIANTDTNPESRVKKDAYFRSEYR